ncbi:hypothetical protein C8F04DRAFT_1114236 [Mycena alexandri]|uniref:NACHT domain-containing protein n=1 Tax=Mycena alexandri TaxID=1745969 RepID=A0AAD6SM26_9AGAR|nr:hypothetical protein C8F04DRAFT_1114236 [Mycena alexandri]
MPAPTQSSTGEARLLNYTAIVVSTIEGIAQSHKVPLLCPTAALSLEVVKMIESVRSNKKLCLQIGESIHGALCTIVKLYVDCEIDGAVPPKLLHDIAGFHEILQKVFTCLKGQQDMGRFKLLFKQVDNKTQLEQCAEALSDCVKMFDLQMNGQELSSAIQVQLDAQSRHQHLLELLSAHPDLNDSVTETASNLSTYGSSCESLPLLPAKPQIFHGRASELEDIVECILKGSARIAILGPGGVGKTALAVAAAHHPRVSAAYEHVHFIPCHSSPSSNELTSSIASHLHLSSAPSPGKVIIQHLCYTATSVLLILDNSETPWENNSSRREVEEFLSLLTQVPNLTLLITMRGAERPGKVQWSRPFFPPLAPLDYFAAMCTFNDIAGADHDQRSVQELLQLTGSLPLAVSLMAHVVASDGCAVALSRWATEHTRLLSDGYDQTSSLDISIALSYTSPRMTSGARDLLSLLAMLPDGISDADLLQSGISIPNILTSKATLLQISLAHVDHRRILQALPPVREYISRIYPAGAELQSTLRQYFHAIIGLWKRRSQFSADSFTRLDRNLGNFHSVFSSALVTRADIEGTLTSVLLLNHFRRFTEIGPSPLMAEVRRQINDWQHRPVYGIYLLEELQSKGLAPIDYDLHIRRGDAYFETADNALKAKWYLALAAHYAFRSNSTLDYLRCSKFAFLLTTQCQHPTAELAVALRWMGQVSAMSGHYFQGLLYAREAQKHMELLGDVVGNAGAILVEGSIQRALGDFERASQLYRKAQAILPSSAIHFRDLLKECQGNIHLRKTEYGDGKILLEEVIESRRSYRPYDSIKAHADLAEIQIAMDLEPSLIEQSLKTAKQQCTIVGLATGHAGCDIIAADLLLRQGDINSAKSVFLRSLPLFADPRADERVLFCMERLADISYRSWDHVGALRWNGICIALAVRTSNRLGTLKGLKRLADIYVTEQENDTALTLLDIAVQGFESMGVHLCIAECNVQISAIWESRGDLLRAIKSLEDAIPRLQRSSQVEKAARIEEDIRALKECSKENLKESALVGAKTTSLPSLRVLDVV